MKICWVFFVAAAAVVVSFRNVNATVSQSNRAFQSQSGGSRNTMEGVSLVINPILDSDPNYRVKSRSRIRPVEPYPTVQRPKCRSVPDITHRDYERMRRDCDGTLVGRRCRISCIGGYQPTKRSVKCVLEQGSTTWDLEGSQCEFNVDTVCRDKHNMKVGWFIVYRFPKNPKEFDFQGKEFQPSSRRISKGEKYIYLSDEVSSQDNTIKWEQDGKLKTQEPGNPISNTLAPLRTLNTNDIRYAMYSDQYRLVDDGVPCNCYVNQNVGHAKGVVMSDSSNNGVLMVHSQPNFPGKPGGGEKYAFDFGQMFMCISFGSNQQQLDKVLSYLGAIRAHVYASRNLVVPEIKPKKLRAAPSNSAPFVHEELMSSNGRDKFDLIAKTHAVDIYSEVLAPFYNTKFDVVTWRNGEGRKLPETAGVCDAKTIHYFDGIVNLQHKESKEHSKWAVSGGSDNRDEIKDIFCISDLNRMESQAVRGGGAVCIRNYNLARAFRMMVSPRNTDCVL